METKSGATLRGTARKAITALVARLPTNTRRSVMDALVNGSNSYGLFQAIGRKHGVRDISVIGDYGVIEGSLADTHVIADYAKNKNWHVGEANRLFVEFFERHNGGTYIDIGANLGLTTIPVAALSSVDCHAFEPDPENYRHLARNVASHCPHGNVKLFNVAVCDHTGVIEFEVDPHNHGDHRIHVDNTTGLLMEDQRSIVAVPATKLDDAFDPAGLKRPIVLKMDTQGAEADIVAGGRRLLAACDLVFMEYWPYSMKRFASDVDAMINFVGRTFSSGSFVPGDTDTPPVWLSIDHITKAMSERWRCADTEPFVYHEIYLRKEAR